MKHTVSIIIFNFILMLGFSQSENKTITDSLIADYLFSGNVLDASGNNNHGTVFGASLCSDRFDNPNSAYYFDGEDDYIEIDPISDVSNITDYTLSVWVFLEEWDEQPGVNANNLDRQYIFDGHSYSSTVYSNFYKEGFYTAFNLYYDYYETLMCGFWNDGSSNPFYSGIDSLNNWHLITYTKEGLVLKQYFDGVLINTVQTLEANMDMQHKWFVGTFSGNNPFYDSFNYNFHGKIDDLKIYKRALNETEILELYDDPQGNCLVADYPFTGNADDFSGNNFNGTLYGPELTTDRFENENSAYFFDGIDDYIDLNAPLLPTNGSDWSLSLWFKNENPADNELKNIFAQYEIDEGRFHTFIYNNELRVFSSSMEHGYTIAQADTNWNHLAFISIGNFINIYLNCMLVAENIAIDNILNTNSLIGDDGSNIINRFFKGKIDDVKIFACALNADELMQLCEYQPECLVADYPFSGNADDVVGNNNGAVYGATLTSDRFGVENSAFYFDGFDDYIEIPNPTPLNFGEHNFAISAWIKTRNTSNTGMIFQKGSTYSYEAPQYWLRSPDKLKNHELVFLTGDANPPSPFVFADNIDIEDGEWHFIIAQRKDSILELYFDGLKVDSLAHTIINVNDSVGAIIGAQHPYPGNPEINSFFNGCIDDIKIYQCSLTDSEIVEIYSKNVVISTRIHEPELLIFPNPSSNYLSVNANFVNSTSELLFYNIAGSVVFRKSVSNFPTEINISSLPQGIYLIKLVNADFSIESKFIKIKQ